MRVTLNQPNKLNLLHNILIAGVMALGAMLMAPATAQTPPDPPLLSSGMAGEVTADRLPMPADADLRRGRNIWQANCQYCHGTGFQGAPKITDRRSWTPRVKTGMNVLTDRAIKGYVGPTGTEMPPKGGAMTLSDEEVRLALVYMVANSIDGQVPR